MAASSLEAAGYRQGLEDWLRDVVVQILRADDLTSQAFDGKIFPSLVDSPIPGIAQPHVGVALVTIEPDRRISGPSSTLSIATVYSLRNFRIALEVGEVSVGAVAEHHQWIMTEGQNDRLEWPQGDPVIRSRRFVEHHEKMTAQRFGNLTDDSRSVPDPYLVMTSTYRLSAGAFRQWRTDQENP